MKIPPYAIIAPEKLTRYLLVPRPTDDKSRFLARAGFNQSNPNLLEAEIRRTTAVGNAIIQRMNQHGTYYSVSGKLQGPIGIALPVRIIWLERLDGIISFVTLVPEKGRLA